MAEPNSRQQGCITAKLAEIAFMVAGGWLGLAKFGFWGALLGLLVGFVSFSLLIWLFLGLSSYGLVWIANLVVRGANPHEYLVELVLRVSSPDGTREAVLHYPERLHHQEERGFKQGSNLVLSVVERGCKPGSNTELVQFIHCVPGQDLEMRWTEESEISVHCRCETAVPSKRIDLRAGVADREWIVLL